MKKGMKQWIFSILVLVLSFTLLAACGKEDKAPGTNDDITDALKPNDDQDDDLDVEDEPVDNEPVMDLGGMEIIIGDWWSPQEPAEPANAYQEATFEYRQMIQEKYNFTIKQVGITDWGGMEETFSTTTIAEEPAAQIFLLEPGWVAAPIANGLVFDLGTLDSLDFTESKWINNVKDIMTFGDSVYGMNAGTPEPKLGVFFNTRLFQEAGLDPQLPYDLQASGEWTWEEFEKICDKLTRDTNNDGIIDYYAMSSFSTDLFRGALTSNDARFIGKDADNKYYNAAIEPNFLEAAQWAVSLIEKDYEMPQPEDANWDYFIQAFIDAKAAMTFAEEYKTGNFKNMEDDFGFVMLPKGPKGGNKYAVYFADNVAVIPSCYDKETAEKIAFAYNLWTEPTPGYEDEDTWKDSYSTKYRDERAIDETLAMMFDEAVENNDYFKFVNGIDIGESFLWSVYALNNTPAEKIEELSGTWKSLIEDANK